jgi:nitrogen fixation NifU-like protein
MGAYDDLLLDHIKQARNYRVMPGADTRIEALNPLCGDGVELFLKWDGGRAADISFQCECCGISMASTSVLTEMLRGRTRSEILGECERFLAHIGEATADGTELDDATPAQRALIDAARRYRSRARCAALAWQSLRDALRAPALTA